MHTAYLQTVAPAIRLPAFSRFVIAKEILLNNLSQAQLRHLNRTAALTINDVLSDPIARTPTFGSSITIPGVAVKTGTTNDSRDAWIIGYTPNLAVGVWSGNNRNEKMRSGGAAVSGPLWKTFMTEMIEKTPSPGFEKPLPDPEYDTLKPILRGKWMGNQAVEIDTVTGMRATDQTPSESKEERVITDVHDTLYWVDRKILVAPHQKIQKKILSFISGNRQCSRGGNSTAPIMVLLPKVIFQLGMTTFILATLTC